MPTRTKKSIPDIITQSKEDENCECATYDNKPVCSDSSTINKVKSKLNISEQNSEEILNQAKKITKCETEVCVLKKSDIPIDNTKFKAEGPLKPREWLSNFEIDDTLQKWSNLERFDFQNCGFAMIDFANYNSELREVSLKKLISKNKNTFGCVINTDKSTGKGKHWMALFIDLRNPIITIEFFNSNGVSNFQSLVDGKKYPEITQWLKSIKNQAEKLNMEAELKYILEVEHQKEDGECGVYSLFYIWARINNVNWHDFIDPSIRVTDDNMGEFRKFLFRS